MTLKEILELIKKSSEKRANDITVPEDNKIKPNLTNAVIFSALTYYLGFNTDAFTSGASLNEIPVYLIYGCLSLLSVQNLESICGKPSAKKIFGSVIGGGVGGAGVGGIIATIALGLVGDIAVTGGLATIGMIGAYFYNKKGKKIHNCGKKLNCQTWICTKCKHIIKPSEKWRTKDRWNLLDVCDYLDTGGFEMDTLKAIAFMDYLKLLNDTQNISSTNPVLWKPDLIKKLADTESDDFNKKFNMFIGQSRIDIENENIYIDNFFEQWKSFNTPTSRQRVRYGTLRK